MSMSESRHQVLLAGQSAIARKVFEMVPIQECWKPLRSMARSDPPALPQTPEPSAVAWVS